MSKYNFKLKYLLISNFLILFLVLPIIVCISVIFIYNPNAWAPEIIDNKVISLYQQDRKLIKELLIDFESTKKLMLTLVDITYKISFGILICVFLNFYLITKKFYRKMRCPSQKIP